MNCFKALVLERACIKHHLESTRIWFRKHELFTENNYTPWDSVPQPTEDLRL